MLLNPFKQALKAGRLQIGLWHSLSSHLAVEILADSGFDWILLDTEHAPNELPMVHRSSFRRWAAEQRIPLFERPGTIK